MCIIIPPNGRGQVPIDLSAAEKEGSVGRGCGPELRTQAGSYRRGARSRNNHQCRPVHRRTGGAQVHVPAPRYVSRGKVPLRHQQDILNSPEYQAQASAIDFNNEVAQAGLRRSLAARGIFGRNSTPAIQAMSAESARYDAQKNALVPQLMQAATARQERTAP
jgi:hypothetical protein